MSKQTSHPSPNASTVRCRRAYFDCRYGQLHVRTAFPATGGFDEQAPLLCLHPPGASSRAFGDLLALAAAHRSVYAPDLPGCGESDALAHGSASAAEAAAAALDLAADLRLRQIDVLGLQAGAAAAVELALARPGLVRALLLAGPAAQDRLALLEKPPQGAQVLHLQAGEFAPPLTADAAQQLVARIDEFLGRLAGRAAR